MGVSRLSNKSKNHDFLKLSIFPLKATVVAFWTAYFAPLKLPKYYSEKSEYNKPGKAKTF